MKARNPSYENFHNISHVNSVPPGNLVTIKSAMNVQKCFPKHLKCLYSIYNLSLGQDQTSIEK